MWRTLLVTAWPGRGPDVPSGAQAAEAARVARTAALAGALAAAALPVSAPEAAPQAASARHSMIEVGFKRRAPSDGDARSVHLNAAA
jgi:hypothetical protein